MAWSITEARKRFSEVVRLAVQLGPQTISVRGREAAVVLSKPDYERLKDPKRPKDFKEWLLSGPPFHELDLERDPSPPRDVDL